LPTFFPPEAGLAHRPVGALPLPIDGPELVTLGDQDGPEALEQAAGAIRRTFHDL
jgi:hypothetical protein